MKRLSIFTRVRCVRQDIKLGRIAGILLMSAASILAVASVFLQAAFPQSTTNFFGGGPPDGAVTDPGVRGGTPGAGQPLPGLTAGQLDYFNQGLDAFEEAIFVQNPPPGGDAGLGPRFNSDSCVSCHAAPAVGGSSPAANL